MKILNAKVNLDSIFKKVPHGSLLMLDYDGTLAPFVKERMQATPYPGVRERLTDLAKLKKSRTVIVSGRSLSDLEKLVDIPVSLELWGSHGLERKLTDGKKVAAPISAKMSAALQQGIEICLRNAGLEYCEIKPFAVAFHWRGMDQDKKNSISAAIENEWAAITRINDLTIYPFDGGLELRPKERNKGDVVRELLNHINQDSAIAYLGDDLTDEDAFAALGDKGLKVLVREQIRTTLADIQLVPPQELLSFLDRWRGAA